MSHLARNLISDVPYWPWDLDIIPWCLSHAHHNVCKCFRLAQKLSYDRWFSDENFRVFGDFSALVRTLLQVISTAVAVYDRLQLESWRAAEAGKSCNLVPAKVGIWPRGRSLDQYKRIILGLELPSQYCFTNPPILFHLDNNIMGLANQYHGVGETISGG